jgi:hypothetical protein
VPAEPAEGGYPYDMARRASHLRSASAVAPVLDEERDRNAEAATDTPTTDPPPSDDPTTGAPVGDPSTADPPPVDTEDATAATDTADNADNARRQRSATGRWDAASSWLGWGAFSGLLAGIAFLAINSWFAVSMGQNAAAPLRTIATIVEGPPPAEAVQGVGVVVHVVLSALFGLIFAALLLPLRRRSAGWIAWAGLLFGGAVYLVDFQFFARSVPWFSAFQATNQPLELAAHLVFGSVLAALLLLAKPRTASRQAPRARASVER